LRLTIEGVCGFGGGWGVAKEAEGMRWGVHPCARRFFVVLFRANMTDAGELVSATLRSIVFVEKHMRKGGAVQPTQGYVWSHRHRT